MDKATVLEDAANYIQELQSRLKELERKNMQGSGIACKRPRLSSSDDNSSSSNEANFEKSSSPCDPGIEVRTSGCNLLVEIYSRANCISLVKVLSKMHEFGLSIISCSTMPFADTTLVTIVAQVNSHRYCWIHHHHNLVLFSWILLVIEDMDRAEMYRE
ncbi:hypothetical protein L1987_24441 [Smallanthus sonchifolius]|uniref:Uncharacterized protein n=1 Tax=Smallanthus sonchifolius TaxID=185202 RepID=A0ACB9IM75_9ASTR|nr:hypothetical protein L1987_24441 [Smallanthus sonchifolius]